MKKRDLRREVGRAFDAALARVPHQPGTWATDETVAGSMTTPNGIVDNPIMRLFVDGVSRKVLMFAPIHPNDTTYGMYLTPGRVVLS